MPTHPHSARLPFTAALLVALASCGGGSSDSGTPDLFVSGAVLSPNGQVIALTAPGTADPVRSPLGSKHERGQALGVSGLLPVPDGTTVELVRLDAVGDTLEVLADTQTSAGGFSFNLTDVGATLASHFAVTAGSGASRMRALVVDTSVDVDPVSEASVQTMLPQGLGLSGFTLQESVDVNAAVRLLTATESIAAGVDVAATIALVQQAIAAEPALANFIASASGGGQTDVGPSDIGEYFPLHVGDAWKLPGTITVDGGDALPRTIARRVVAVDVQGVFTIEEFESGDTGSQAGELREKTSAGILNRGVNVPGDELSRAVQPFLEFRFPLRVGEEREQFEVHGIELDFDIDADGIGESMDARSLQTTVGFEDLTVSAGSFERCVRIDTRLELLFHFSTGPRATMTSIEREWFAPGIGIVRRSNDETTVFDDGVEVESSEAYALESFQVGPIGHGVLPPLAAAIDLTDANSNAANPGRPAIASDGSWSLIVTCRDFQPPARLVGVFIRDDGLSQGEITISAQDLVSNTAHPAVAFDGTNYLVVFRANRGIVGVRVTPEGNVLDTTPFAISTGGSSNSSPAIAFDGAQYLVAWSKFQGFPSDSDIYASFVTPSGAALGEFEVNSMSAPQGSPDVVFANGNHVVIWTEGGLEPEIRGARITPAGVVLDPTGFDVVDDTEPQFEPRVASDGDRFLVVWSRQPVPSSFGYHIYGSRLESDCTQLDVAPFPIATGSDFWAQPTVAFDGTNYLVAWGSTTFSAPFGIHATRVSSDGELLDGAANSNGITIDEPTEFATRLMHPVLAISATRALIAWVVNLEVANQTKSVECAVIHPF